MTRVFENQRHNVDTVPVHSQNNLQNNQSRPNFMYINKDQGTTLSGFVIIKYIFYAAVGISVVAGGVVLVRSVISHKAPQSCQCLATEYSPPKTQYAAVVETNSILECTAYGDRHCQSLCTSLVLNNPSVYKMKMCQKEPYAYKYVGNVYYRACAQDTWLKTPLQVTACCRHGTEYVCPANEIYN